MSNERFQSFIQLVSTRAKVTKPMCESLYLCGITYPEKQPQIKQAIKRVEKSKQTLCVYRRLFVYVYNEFIIESCMNSDLKIVLRRNIDNARSPSAIYDLETEILKIIQECVYVEPDHTGQSICTEYDQKYESDLDACGKELVNAPKFSGVNQNCYMYALYACDDIKAIDFELDCKNYEKKNYLVRGAVQSGKTLSMMALAQASISYGISTVILVQNYVKDFSQLKARISKFESERYRYLVDQCNIDPCEIKPLETSFVGIRTKKNIARISAALRVSVGEPHIIICLANGSEMKRLNTIINTLGNDYRYNLVVDESDAIYKGVNTGFRIQISSLCRTADKVIGYTATTYDVIINEGDLTNTHVIMMQPKADYKGVQHLMIRSITPYADKHYDPSKDDSLLPVYSQILTIPVYNNMNKEHPILVLHKTSQYVVEQNAIQSFFRNHPVLGQYTTLVYNGQGVRLYSRHLVDHPVIRYMNTTYTNEGGYIIMKKISISSAIEYLRLNGGVELHHHIVIVSGKTADRGTSFVSENYDWYLTHEYLRLPGRNTVSTILQALRICGRYKDNIPLELITTPDISTDCIKAERLQIDMLTKATQYPCEIGIQKFLQTHEILESDMPKHKISKFPYRHILNIVRSMNNSQASTLTINMFRERVLDDLYHNKNSTKIRLLRFFKNRQYATRAEIESMCKLTISPNYDRWTNDHRQYKIVVQCKPGVYTLNDEIKGILNELE